MSAKLTITIPTWLDKLCAWPVMIYRKQKYGYTYRRIYLGEGFYTILDEADYYRFNHYKWYVYGWNGKYYAQRHVKVGNRTKPSGLHREIMNAGKGQIVDHENGTSLDNRGANLRFATHRQNTCNRKKRANTSSRFIGVCFHKRKQKWIATVEFEGKKYWIGTFDNEIEAAKARDEAAKRLHKNFARLNFP
jgi:hypothetical protein